jgi:hypothetical protein
MTIHYTSGEDSIIYMRVLTDVTVDTEGGQRIQLH